MRLVKNIFIFLSKHISDEKFIKKHYDKNRQLDKGRVKTYI